MSISDLFLVDWPRDAALEVDEPADTISLADDLLLLHEGARGLLVSVAVPADVAARLAVPGGEPPAALHITLCYVGDARELPPDDIADLVDAVEAVVVRTPPFTFDVVGTGRFPASPQSDGMDVLYAEVKSAELLALRERIYAALTRAGSEPNHNFPYTPHITIQYVTPEQAVTPLVAPVTGVPVTTIDVGKDALVAELPLGQQFVIDAAALAALQRLATSTGPNGQVVVRSSSVFRKPLSPIEVPLNRKTTANEVTAVRLADLEPRQEFIPVSGLTKYIAKPRRDPADVARIETPNGVRYVVQEGHTRLGAALLRGEADAEVRQWQFQQNPAGGYDPVPRGMHKRGMALSYRERLVLELGDRSKYPGGRYPGEQEAGDDHEALAAVEYGKSGKPIPEWRLKRRAEKEAAKGGTTAAKAVKEDPKPVVTKEPVNTGSVKAFQNEAAISNLRGTKVNASKLETALKKSGDAVLREGGKYEVMHVLNGAGETIGKSSGTEGRVKIGGAVAQAMHQYGSNLTVMHNHPEEGSLSPTDYRTSALPGIKEIVAVTHDGSVYRGKGNARDIGPLWKGKFDAAHAAAKATGDYRAMEAARTFAAHVVNQALAEDGHLSYSHTFGPRTTAKAKDYAGHIATMAEAARSGGKRVRERRVRTRSQFIEGLFTKKLAADRPVEDDEYLIDPPFGGTDAEWWTFIDEMDEYGVPEALWAPYVPDGLGPRGSTAISLSVTGAPDDVPALNLPDIADVSFPSVVGAIPSKPKRKKKPVTYRGVTLGRRPTDFEAHVLSLSAIPRRYDLERDRLVEALATRRREHLTTLMDTPRDGWAAVAKAARSRTAEALVAAQDRMARYGVVELRNECRRQGLVIADLAESDAAFTHVRLASVLTESVRLMTDALHAGWMASLDRIALKVTRTKRARAAILALAEREILFGLKATARHLLHEAFGVPRQAYATRLAATATRSTLHLRKVDDDEAEELVDYVIQSAVMDVATCDPCAEADGLTFDYGDDDMDEYAPPYINCDGGDNCRCVQIYVLKNGDEWVVREDKILP